MTEKGIMGLDSFQVRLEVMDRLLRGASIQEVLDFVCSCLDTLTPGICSCLFRVDSSGEYLLFGAAPGMPLEFQRAVDRMPIAPAAKLYGQCAWQKSRVLLEDIFLEPDLEPFYAGFRLSGRVGCWCQPLFDENGTLLGVFAAHLPPLQPLRIEESALLDASDLAQFSLQRLDLSLRRGQGQSLLERAYQVTSTAVCWCQGFSPEAVIRGVNQAFCSQFGGSQNDWLGLSLVRLLPGVAEFCVPTGRSEQTTAITQARRQNGSIFPCEVRLISVSDDFDPTTLLLVTMVDITRRLEDFHQEKQIESRFRRIFEEVPHIAVRGCAPDGSVRFWNPASERLFGYSASEALNRCLPHRLESANGLSNEYELLRKDGTPILVYGASVAISTPGVGLEVYTMEVDLSPLKEAEKERIQLLQLLLQAQKLEALGQLTGGIAHNFNNVLATILGNIELARREMTTDLLDEIQVCTERAQGLVQKMIAYSRSHSSEPESISLQELIPDICRVLRALVPSCLDLRVNLDPATPPAMFNPIDLHQILSILVINSRDALQGHGAIEVGLRPIQPSPALICSSCLASVAGPHVELWVKDSGPGIDEAIRGRLFDPFFTTKGLAKGTGLGLAVLHRLVHERGGHVVVEGEGGARFSVILKLAQESAPSTVPAAPRPEPLVMIVDDEPMLAKMLGKLVKTQGYQVEVYTDPLAAWTEFSRDPGRYSALVTDQTMPGRSGHEFARDALKLRPDLPILLCTGFSENIDGDSAQAMGIGHFLQKPVKPAVLFQTLASMIFPGRDYPPSESG